MAFFIMYLEIKTMVFTEFAKVKNVLTVDTKYGKRRVCNVTTEKHGEEAIWAEDLKAFSNIRSGQQIQVIRGAKGKLSILEQEPPRNVNGNGLKPVKEVLDNVIEDYVNDDLGLPDLLTDQQKKNLKKLTEERAKLLVYCIEVMKKEMDAKGFDFYENSVRSLGVSLYIAISKYLP